MNLAIIGATGNVGRKIIEVLEKSKIEIEELFLIASEKSVGKKLKFKNKEIEVTVLEEYDFSSAEFTIFAAGKTIAQDWIPIASNQTTIIDNSSCFRMDNNVPLIVPEVNPEALKSHENIISNPNCSTIQLVLVLKPLHELYKIKRVVVSTYQAVSGAGKDSMDELFNQTREYLDNKKIKSKNFTKQIAFNLIPHIDTFVEDGYTKEEWKMENETKKILDKEIDLTATCVRVPVKTSHSESVNIEFEKE
jgi:aspartate-semialdehyde dehydrogenase